MSYYILVFLTIALISIGLVLLKKPFFSFAYATSVLLNIMMDSSLDDAAKQKKHLESLGNLLVKFGILLVLIVFVLAVSFIPLFLYTQFSHQSVYDLDTSSFYFYLSMILGSAGLFFYPTKNKKKDYSYWSQLLHKMILDNYNISRSLFRIEKKLYNKKISEGNTDFVIVTGLARGGTTALTNLLYASDRFYSLSYDNMPFLLSVNIWRKFYSPRKNKLKERAHGDNILFGYTTIEALEEHFFKVFLQDKFIESNGLIEHEIDDDTYTSYLLYQKLIGIRHKNKIYLAKNNNLAIRYKSLRKYNADFKIFLIFRSPISHAYSLLNQHKRFCKLHKEDPFALEYMNWLGHHEFGLNHKVFQLGNADEIENYSFDSINYWLAIWVSYYSYILSFPLDNNLVFIDYSDLCNNPNKLIRNIGAKLNLNLYVEDRSPYNERSLPSLEIDLNLLKKANQIYELLKGRKLGLIY